MSLRPTSSTCSPQASGTSLPPGAGAAMPGADDGEAPLVGLHARPHCHASNSSVTIRRPPRLSTKPGGRSRPERHGHDNTTPDIDEAAPQRRPRDPARTKRDILVAAREEFVEYGLEGARVDRIAERAGANKRMLYHYVGNKEALYSRVLLDAYRDIRAGEADLHLGELAAGAAPWRSSSASPSTISAGNPWFIRLLATENIQRGAFVREHAGDPRAALAARRPDHRGARGRRGRRHLPARGRPGAALHHHRRRQLFLPVEHPYALGDLRQRRSRPTPTWPRGGRMPSRWCSATCGPENRLRRNNQGVTFEAEGPRRAPRNNDPGALPVPLGGSDDTQFDPARLRRPAGRARPPPRPSPRSAPSPRPALRPADLVGQPRPRPAHQRGDRPLRQGDRHRGGAGDLRLERLLAEARHPGRGAEPARPDPDGLPLHLRIRPAPAARRARRLRRQAARRSTTSTRTSSPPARSTASSTACRWAPTR